MNGQTFHPKAALDLGRSTTRHTDYVRALNGLHRGPSKSTGYIRSATCCKWGISHSTGYTGVFPQAISGPSTGYTGSFQTSRLHCGPSTGYSESTPASVSAQHPPLTVHLCSHWCCLLFIEIDKTLVIKSWIQKCKNFADCPKSCASTLSLYVMFEHLVSCVVTSSYS